MGAGKIALVVLLSLAGVCQSLHTWVRDSGDASAQGEGSLTIRAGRQAEVHELEGVMNSDEYNMPQGLIKAENEIAAESDKFASAMHDIMGGQNSNPVAETQESITNGANNEAYLAERAKANDALPDNTRHKTLREIWQKELPCECPFNVWKPVCGVDGHTYPTACFADCIGMSIFVHADCKYVKRELWARYHAKMDNIPVDFYEDCEEGDDDAPDEPRHKCRKRALLGDDVQITHPEPFAEQALFQATAPETTQTHQAPHVEAAAPAQTQQVHMIVPPPKHTQPTPAAPPSTKPRGTKAGADQISKLEHRLGRRLHSSTASQPAAPTEEAPSEVDIPVPIPESAPVVAEIDTPNNHIEWREFNGVKVPYDTREFPNPCPQCPQDFAPACGTDGKTYPSACFAVCVGAQIKFMGECPE